MRGANRRQALSGIPGANLRQESFKYSWRKFAPRIFQEFLAQICAKNFLGILVYRPRTIPNQRTRSIFIDRFLLSWGQPTLMGLGGTPPPLPLLRSRSGNPPTPGSTTRAMTRRFGAAVRYGFLPRLSPALPATRRPVRPLFCPSPRR